MIAPTMPVRTRQTSRARQSRRETRERIVTAATELIRRLPYGELSVDEVMREAGIGRTLFYRHFDDLGNLLVLASREAIDQLYEAQRAIADAGPEGAPDALRRALEAGVAVYERHGPLLRAVAEAAASDELIAQGYAQTLRRFDALAEQALRQLAGGSDSAPSDLAETARALNRMNESYLVDTFGREPRASAGTAVQTLTEIWEAVLQRP